jgi:hypothetical protein
MEGIDVMNKETPVENGESCAYPAHDQSQYWGLTKRELFAAMIAQGLAGQFAQGNDFMETHVAKGAVLIADALLKELSR